MTVFLAPIGFVLVVVGLILGIVDTVKKGKTGENKGISIAGLIICAIFFIVLMVENLIMILGLIVYTTTTNNGILENAQRVQEAQLFNEAYEPYVGIQTGANVRALLTKVNSNNMINKQNTIFCLLDGMEAEPNILAARISIVKQYEVILICDEDEYVSQINITSIGTMDID